MEAELTQSGLPDPPSTGLTGVILCGGKSQRFGRDKARAEINGQPLISRVADLLAPHCQTVVAVAETADKYSDLGLVTLGDEITGDGPLAGLLTALHYVQSRSPKEGEDSGWVLLTSCDLTELHPNWVVSLAAARSAESVAVVFTEVTAERSDPLFQPFPGLYHVNLADSLAAALQSGARSFQRVLGELGGRVQAELLPVDWPSVPQINTAKQLERYRDQSP